MNQNDKRALENELVVMGLPGLDDPNLIQSLADLVNGYPIMAERVEFFCDLLNECEGSRRREMYEAMRPRLSFPTPPLDVCEERIAAKAERMVRPKGLPPEKKDDGLVERTIELVCGACKKEEQFTGLSTADAMSAAHKAGWGRGPIAGQEHCAECRLTAMLPNRVGPSLTRRHLSGEGVNG